ncbi:MAG: rod shape-determining protein RodA [Chloroflexi bacterium]|nr:FtsW/RodA/SpoVE family cell cycle protein [Chloroflexota bacterium]MQC26848.1 rod shape-determining protein RodA [Chloroflexota bacterium]
MKSSIWRHFDFWLLGAVAVLIIFGVAMIRSTIAGNIELIELDIVGRQIIYALAGLVVIVIAASQDYRLWISVSRVLYVILAILLLFIALSGAGAEGENVRFGAARWLNIGIVLIQPSELAKITMIILLADFFARNRERIKQPVWIFRSILSTLGLVTLILLQPDLSTSIVLLVIWFALLWASGLQLKHLALFGLLGIVGAAAIFPFLQDYQQQRVINLFFPDPDARHGENYNVNQALISIGSGGVLGQGYGQSSQVQLRFLKVRHNDFIFSAISAEFGLIGDIIIIGLLFFVIWRCVRAARLSQDTFGALLAYGVATTIAFHTIVNIGMNIQLLPVTGLPLPFISAGGSSLLSLMLGIGLVESVIVRHRALDLA